MKLNNFSIKDANFIKFKPYQFQPRCISYIKCLENTPTKNLNFQRLKKYDAIFFSIFKRCCIFLHLKKWPYFEISTIDEVIFFRE